jgi:hypothetical protein
MSKKESLADAQKSVWFLSTLITDIIRELRKVFLVAIRSVHEANEKASPNSIRVLVSEYEFGCDTVFNKIIVAGLDHGGNYPGSSSQRIKIVKPTRQ